MTDTGPAETGQDDVAGSTIDSEIADILAGLSGQIPFGFDPFDVFYSNLADPTQTVFGGTKEVRTGRFKVAGQGSTNEQRLLSVEAFNRFGAGFFDAIPGARQEGDRRNRSTRTGAGSPLQNVAFDDTARNIAGRSDTGLFEDLRTAGLLEAETNEEDIFSSVGDLVRGFYEFDDRELARLQRVMYVGGFYGTSTRFEDVQFGVPDEQSYSAWVTAVMRTARFNAAGKKLTVDDVLEEAARKAGVGVNGGFKDRAGVDVVVSLSDPAGLRERSDQLARQVLGRQATADEERLAIAIIHGLQRESQTDAQTASTARNGIEDQNLRLVGGAPSVEATSMAGQAGFPTPEATDIDVVQDIDPVTATADDTVTEITPPDVDARITESLRSSNPNEAQAMDLMAVLTNLSQLLSGGR